MKKQHISFGTEGRSQVTRLKRGGEVVYQTISSVDWEGNETEVETKVTRVKRKAANIHVQHGAKHMVTKVIDGKAVMVEVERKPHIRAIMKSHKVDAKAARLLYIMAHQSRKSAPETKVLEDMLELQDLVQARKARLARYQANK